MGLRALLWLTIALPAAPLAATPPARPFWTWRDERPPAALEVDFIRADITVIRREGPLEIELFRTPLGGRADEVEIGVAEARDTLVLRDLYPASVSSLWDECLPPPNERGDFWRNRVMISGTIRVPASTRVVATVREGRVEERGR